MVSTDRNILSLARSILRSSEQIVEYLERQQHEAPSFDLSMSEPPSSLEYDKLRTQLNDTATDLMYLVNGPKHYYRQIMWSPSDLAALQSAVGLGLFEKIPQTGSVSLADLATNTGSNEQHIGQVMRLLTTQRMFEEVEENVFQHTASSQVAAQDAEVRALLGCSLDEFFKASSGTLDWLRSAPQTSNSENCPFTQSHGMSLYEYLDQDPARATRFAQGMGGVVKFDRQTTELFTEYPWQNLHGGKVVDVGGGSGHISMKLAERFPTIKVVVQDVSPKMLAQGLKLDVYSRIQDRVTFAEHDFFTAQPIHDANAFILRQVAHNWNDEDLVKIFRAFVPALEKCPKGTPLLINDTILPELGRIPRSDEHFLRQMDVLMLVLLGTMQRSEKQFRQLLKAADDRFEVIKVSSDGSMGLIEVHLEVEKN